MKKNPPGIHARPEDVEQAFYEAIARGDAEQIGRLWAEEEETLCVHPTGVRLTGLAPIRESWRSIFAATRLRVQVEVISHWQGSVLAIHHLSEILFVGDDSNPRGPLYVTHVYARGPRGWRLVCRHASTADDSQQALADGVRHTVH
ncbi:MAG: nuclear transport factor 2 family protein [Azonexus sp.]|jgi:ketosteroid isomerase-like protein|uniref:YybH family protein n=1 Tax=Azonexus sp. TaxID=1872668 RepID=UPI0028315A35|nr:nuclear transport factor 2 family protein [Azonexus sp.]MDR0777514.1 nuclear transport factor 2 family protein [Azonexus sp.]